MRGKNAKGSRKRRRWTADEEKAVKDGYQLYGDKWAKILREFSVLKKGGRTSADIRDKWRNLVKKDPALAGPPKRAPADGRTDDEDDEDEEEEEAAPAPAPKRRRSSGGAAPAPAPAAAPPPPAAAPAPAAPPAPRVPADAWVPVCAEWCRKRLVAEPDAKVHISTVRDAFASSTALPAAHAGALREAFKRPKSRESKAFKKTLEAIVKGNIKNQVVIDGKNQVGILHFRLKGDHVADDDEEVLSDAGAAEPAAEEEEEEEEEESCPFPLHPPCNSMTLSFRSWTHPCVRQRSAPSSASSSAAAISSDTARGDSVSGSLTIDDERRVRLLCTLGRSGHGVFARSDWWSGPS